MSEQVGARRHASAALTPHVSRVAAVGLAVFLAFGYGAATQADEGSGASGIGGAEVGGTTDAGDGTADAGDESRTGAPADTDTGSGDQADRPGQADATIEISATSSDTDLVTLVVVTADGGRTTTVTPSPDPSDAAPPSPGKLWGTDTRRRG